ncbi:MAG: hypothetical protein IPH52_18010 [Leptospiraceae bacterium]|nr:hypothetical protein [Leptospiraceae bacterium]
MNASSYGNFPNEIAKGQTLVYIFIPDKFYRNAKDVFVKIKEYYDESGLDIERTFLAISSIFYESNFIHVGTRIKQNESLFRGLRQFLFFKTGNENFAKKIDITSELINYTDTTTFRNILKRLPLPYYLKDIKLTQKEKSNLDAMSGKFYETVKDIEEFTNLIESDRIKIFESILDKKKLKYSDADLKILNWKRKDYDKKKNIFFSERFALISGAIVKKYKAYMKRVSNTDR